jgi:hypothetical protein
MIWTDIYETADDFLASNGIVFPEDKPKPDHPICGACKYFNFVSYHREGKGFCYKLIYYRSGFDNPKKWNCFSLFDVEELERKDMSNLPEWPPKDGEMFLGGVSPSDNSRLLVRWDGENKTWFSRWDDGFGGDWSESEHGISATALYFQGKLERIEL